MNPFLRFLAPIAACAGLGFALGCSSSEPPPPPEPPKPADIGVPDFPEMPIAQGGDATLQGKVTHKGEPVAAGKLVFYSASGIIPAAGNIESDGRYLVGGLPEGELQVCVLLDPEGELPFPTFKRPASGSKPEALGPPMPPTPPGDPKGPPPPPMPPGPPQPPGLGAPTAPDQGHLPGQETTSGEVFPKGLPPPFVEQLRRYSVPAEKKKAYSELHKKYRHPTLKVTVKTGENTHDVELR